MAINIDHTKHLISPNASTTIKFDTTGSIIIPVGTQSQRGTAATGAIRVNSNSDTVEYYDGTDWRSVVSVIINPLLPPNDGQTVLWDTATNSWILGNPFSQSDFDSAFGTKSIDNLSDVDTTTIEPSPGQSLIWNGTNWIPGTADGGAQSLDELTDVEISILPGVGDALVWDGTVWRPGPVSVVGTLNDLSDVDTVSAAPIAGQALVWDETNSLWKPGTIEGFSGDYNDLINKPSIPSTLDDLLDVDTSAHPVVNGYVLKWNSALEQWIPSPDATGGGGGGGGATYLDELEDVETILNPPQDGYALIFDQAQGLWIPKARWDQTAFDSAFGAKNLADLNEKNLADLDDVYFPTAPTTGQVLKYDAVNLRWVASDDLGGSGAGGSGRVSSTTILLDRIIFDGVTETFPVLLNALPYFPVSTENVIVTLNGVYQIPYSAYEINGSNITFAEAPETDDIVSLVEIGVVKGAVKATLYRYSITSATTVIAGVDNIGRSLYYTPGDLSVYLNGVRLQDGVDYTATDESTITFGSTLLAGDFVEIESYSANNKIDDLDDVDTSTVEPAVGQVLRWNGVNWIPGTVAGTGTGGNVIAKLYQFTLATDASSVGGVDDLGNGLSYINNNLSVYVNGVRVLNHTDYTATDGETVDFVAGLLAGDVVEIEAFTPIIDLSGNSIDELDDVDTTTVAPLDGQALVWNAALAQWVPGTVGGGTTGSAISQYQYAVTATSNSVSGLDVFGNVMSYLGDNLDVYVNGIRLGYNQDYTATTGYSVDFEIELTAGSRVDVDTWNDLDLDQTRYQYTIETATTTITGADLNANVLAYSADRLNVYVNGSRLSYGNDYSATDGSSIELLAEIPAGSYVEVDTWADSPADILRYQFTVSSDITELSGNDDNGNPFTYVDRGMNIYVNGVLLSQSNDYSAYSGTTVTFSSPVFAGSIIEVDTWVGAKVEGVNDLNSLTDVTIAAPEAGQVLLYNGTNWVNTTYAGLHSNDTTVYFATTTTVDTFDKGVYRSAKYLLQATTGTDYHVTEIVLIHNDTDVYVSEYGTTYTNTSLIAVTADVNGADVRLRVTPVGAPTSVKLKRIDIEV